ncbi:MAG: efflux RND transporter periplasmic adaptor subunit [Prolixibacteraceae bacterium]|nr:efflux RND transporter periplasmic adaptor subunit [Prolixibacteraceae bacterium]
MKRKIIFLPLVGILLIILIVVKVVHSKITEKKQILSSASQPVMAECFVARDTMPEFIFTTVGYIRANESVELVSELSLRLISIHFTEGSFVQKGSVLFQLDDAAIKADLKKNDAKLEYARNTEQRNKDLLSTGGISQQVYDESLFALKVLEAEKESLLVLLDKTTIKAPFSGMAGIRKVSEGAFVTPGKVLTTLEDISRLKIDFTLAETYAAMVQKGKKLNFEIDGIPEVFTATVFAVNPSINPETGNLKAVAIIDSPDARLKAGSAISLEIGSKTLVSSIYVPTQALIPTPGGFHAYIMNEGLADYRKVLIGMRLNSMVEIKEGIQSGDSVLVTGFMKVRPNTPVKIVKVW